MEGVVCTEESAQTPPCVVGLCPSFWGELYAVVGDRLVDVAVFWVC